MRAGPATITLVPSVWSASPPSPLPGPPPPPSPPPGPDEGIFFAPVFGVPLIGLIGAGIGAVLLVAGCVALVVWKVKQRRARQRIATPESKMVSPALSMASYVPVRVSTCAASMIMMMTTMMMVVMMTCLGIYLIITILVITIIIVIINSSSSW